MLQLHNSPFQHSFERSIMEFMGLIQELNQGKQLANQLRRHLHPSSSSSHGILLIDQILRSYENALSVLAGGGDDEIAAAKPPMNAAVKEREVSKKRKVMAQWSEQVKVPLGSTIEASLSDGFSWRKYGQKDILGSKFPRGYFRCSHRFTQGCFATKQVQKSDNDPAIYDITYKEKHTCNKVSNSNTPKEEQKPSLQVHPMPPNSEQKPLQQQHDPLCLAFSSDTIRVKSEKLDDGDVSGRLLRPICAPSLLFGSEVQDDQSPFRESELSPTFESNDVFGVHSGGVRDWDLETGFVSFPSSFTNISMEDLEECCSFDNLVEFFC